jgi:hypothetical protein
MLLRLLPLGPCNGHKSGATAPLALPTDGHISFSSPSASIPSVRTVAYVIAGVVIVLSIIFSVRAWILDRRDKASKLAAAEA